MKYFILLGIVFGSSAYANTLDLSEMEKCADLVDYVFDIEDDIDSNEATIDSLDRQLSNLETTLSWSEAAVSISESTYLNCWDNCWNVEQQYRNNLASHNSNVNEFNRLLRKQDDVYEDYEYNFNLHKKKVRQYNDNCTGVTVSSSVLDEVCGNRHNNKFCNGFD